MANAVERPRGVNASATYDKKRKLWVDGKYWFDERAADRAVSFFETKLCFSTGEWAGRPFLLEGWQQDDIVRPAFGWKKADGTRRYRKIYVWVPRKNGKTELAAGVSLLALLGDGEYGAEIYSIAKDKDQASIVFNKASEMINLSPELSGVLETYKTSIFYPPLNGSFKALSGKASGKHGLNTSGLIGDEIHEWNDGELYQFMTDSESARRQPIEFLISTAGKRGGYGEEIWDECIKIRDGIIDDEETLVVIYAADQEDDWTDPKIWEKANPNLGVSKKLERMKSDCNKAKQLPRLQNSFKNYQLNIWTDQASLWLPIDMTDDEGRKFGWDQCIGKHHWSELETVLAGKTCFGGLDLSSTNDLSALCLWFPVQSGLDYPTVLMRFWKPRALLAQHSKRDKLPYEKWHEEGALFASPGNVVDYEAIRQQIYADGIKFNIAYAGQRDVESGLGGIAIDRWNATETSIKLQDEGLPVVLFGQGFASMNAPSKDIELLLLSNGMRHGGHPVLREHAKVVTVEESPTKDIKPSKAKSTQRIDGIVAMVMAKGIASTGLPNTGSTPWDDDPEFEMSI
ncbi:terminase large subunit [Lentilitoribacter sp. EG35]|uniref:terminase large subunit n=1 Tax=Lentilitoribacter sp. EG35 TaxID=3234192 RepID=UPI003460C3F9